MRTRKLTFWLVLLAVIGLIAAGCSDDSSDTGSGEAKSDQTLRMVPADFPENETLTQVYGQYLEAQGWKVEIQPSAGQREQLYPLLEQGQVDMIIDYTGSAATFLDESGMPSPDPAETYQRLQSAIDSSGTPVQALEYARDAEDANALVVLKSFAEENDLATISDLKEIEDQVVLGGSPQCPEREDCLLGYQNPDIYGLNFKEFKAIEYGPPLATALQSGEIQAAQYQTTAPEIASGDFVVLEDDKGLASADNIVPVIREEAAQSFGDDLISDVNELSEQITTEDIIGWNESTDIDKEDPAAVAERWLQENDLA